MTSDQIIITIIAFVAAYITSYFLRGFIRERRILKVFLKHDIVSEGKAKKMNDLSFPETGDEPIRLIPLVHLFQKKILRVTKDNRVYLNKQIYQQKLVVDVSVLVVIYLIFTGVILLTLHL